MKTIELKIAKKIESCGEVALVKIGGKTQAKIYQPSKSSQGEFTIVMSGCAFYRPSMEESIAYVKNTIEERLSAFSF
jgi:hypothetical protein